MAQKQKWVNMDAKRIYYKFKVSNKERICKFSDCGKKFIANSRLQKYCTKRCCVLARKQVR